MCKVYLYSRVSTSQQTLAQQERTAYEWLKAHNMTVDEVVSDEGVSGGVSYAERNLGKVLLPKTHEGDMIIVSEISRLGRSMFNLSELIHKELKPRKIRLVCVNMGIDLNCAKMTAIDELIISNFSFAAQLEKQLISERTLSALQVKRKQGVKFGSASEKYKENYAKKTRIQIEQEAEKRGKTRRDRHHQDRNIVAMVKIIRKVFPCETMCEDPKDFEWNHIDCKEANRVKILSYMRDFADMDETGNLFRGWDFTDIESNNGTAQKLRSYIQRIRCSYKKENV